MSVERRLLIVDDDELIIRALTRRLSNAYYLSGAYSMQEGLRLIETQRPFGVIVTDLNMPGGNGFALLEAARRVTPDTVPVLLTGDAQAEIAERAEQLGVYRVHFKPCPSETLAQTVEEGFEIYFHRLREAVAEATR